MKNKIIIPTILFIVVLGFSSFLLLQTKNQPDRKQSQIILFYGDGCPHCEIVDKYIEDNKIEEKVSFVRKEVYNNEKNQKELIEKAKACAISDNNIGVPFLWEKGMCFVGDQDIIDFFKLKINELDK